MEPNPHARARLAEQAARQRLDGLDPMSALSGLRLLTTAELLCPGPGPRHPADTAAVLETVCAAVQAGVRRRAGWLYAMVPPGRTLPVAVHPRLMQAAVLCVLRGALRTAGSRAVIRCMPGARSLVLSAQGGACALTCADTILLWKRMAAECGGAAVFGAGPVFTAAARLPLCSGIPAAFPSVEDLLRDRYALPYVYLGEWLAHPWA